MTRVVGSWNTD